MENSHRDPVVVGEMTLEDILCCQRGLQGEALDTAVNFFWRLRSEKERKAKHELFVLQAKLWDAEQKLNTPMSERIVLEQGWLNGPSYELAHLYVRMTERLKLQTAAFKEMGAEYGNADDVREQILKLCNEYAGLDKPTGYNRRIYPPRGFRSMNSKELQAHLKWAKELVDYAREGETERVALAEQHKAAAARRAEELVLFAAIDAKRKERKAQIDHEIASYKDAVAKLNEHPVFRMASLKAVSLYPVLDSDYQLVRMSDAEFDTLLAQSRGKVVATTRSLREPLRRAWQSAQSRGVTRLGFQEYLSQEGFGSLFTA